MFFIITYILVTWVLGTILISSLLCVYRWRLFLGTCYEYLSVRRIVNSVKAAVSDMMPPPGGSHSVSPV